MTALAENRGSVPAPHGDSQSPVTPFQRIQHYFLTSPGTRHTSDAALILINKPFKKKSDIFESKSKRVVVGKNNLIYLGG